MAERLAQHYYPDHQWESAGVAPQDGIHSCTARVLADHGCDASEFTSREVVGLDLSGFDHLVLIGETAQACTPDPPAHVQVHHWNVPDPYDVRGTDEDVLAAYQDSWDDLHRRIAVLMSGLPD